MKISTHFSIYEFVPKEIYAKFGDKSLQFIDQRVIDIAEVVRQRFEKPVTINNWNMGGNFNNRGFRSPDCAIGAFYSQHKAGRGIDINVQDIEVVDVYNDVIKNFDLYKKVGLTTIEDISKTPGWTHLDCRKTNQDEILIVLP